MAALSPHMNSNFKKCFLSGYENYLYRLGTVSYGGWGDRIEKNPQQFDLQKGIYTFKLRE